MIRTLVLSMFGVLMFCGTSSAAFVFSLESNAENVEIGGSKIVNLVATSNINDRLTDFAVFVTRYSGGPEITPISSSVMGSGVDRNFTANVSQIVGSFFFGATGSATAGQVGKYNLTGASYSDNAVPQFQSQFAQPAITVTVVPEPTSLMMFGSVVGLWMVRRRRS
jgi:hypothetical protein